MNFSTIRISEDTLRTLGIRKASEGHRTYEDVIISALNAPRPASDSAPHALPTVRPQGVPLPV